MPKMPFCEGLFGLPFLRSWRSLRAVKDFSDLRVKEIVALTRILRHPCFVEQEVRQSWNAVNLSFLLRRKGHYQKLRFVLVNDGKHGPSSQA